MEIIVISEKDLHRRVDINGNQNICGAKLNDGDPGTDNINVLTSEYGNLMIMKAAAIIAHNPNIFLFILHFLLSNVGTFPYGYKAKPLQSAYISVLQILPR